MKEKILAIDFLQHSTKFAVVKKDKENRFLIEVICIENTSEEIIYLNDLFINSSSIQHINKFQCLSSDNFYFNASIWENEKLVRYHLKVNFSGKIIKQTVDDLDEKYINAFDRDLVFFDRNEFKEINLMEFFEDFFSDDEFFYHYYSMGSKISSFFSSDNKKLGICYFFKDGEYPRGRFTIFNIENFEKPKVIFSKKVEDFGNDIKFTYDNSKISYWRWGNYDEKSIVIEYAIRELNELSFENEKRIEIKYFSNDFSMRNYYFISSTLIKQCLNKFELFDIVTSNRSTILRDVHSPYCINGTTMIYIHNSKLEKLFIS